MQKSITISGVSYVVKDTTAMTSIMIPVLTMLGREALYDEQIFKSLSTSVLIENADVKFMNTNMSENDVEQLTWGVICIKKYNIDQAVVIKEINKKNVIPFCFDMFMEIDGFSFFDKIKFSSTNALKDINVSHSFKTDVEKCMAMKVLTDRMVVDMILENKKMVSDYGIIYGALNVSSDDENTSSPPNNNIAQAGFALIMCSYYNMNIDVAIAFAKYGKAIERCFELFITNTAIQAMSALIGDPVSNSIN